MKKIIFAIGIMTIFGSCSFGQSNTFLGTNNNTVVVRNRFRITKLPNTVGLDSILATDASGNFINVLKPTGGSGEPVITASNTTKKYWNGYKSFVALNTDSIGVEGVTNLWYTNARVQTFGDTRYATLASPALTGVPTAPTAVNGTNTTQIATTAFVLANAGGGGGGGTITNVTATDGVGQTWSVTGTTVKNLALSLTSSAVGLGNVDNTSDINKPISTATQTALNLKANIASPTFTGTVGGITKAMVGLSNVDNTSDLNKPISTATQTALNLKANLSSPTFTGTVSGISKTMVGLGNVDNTSDASKPVSTATQTALNLKADLAGATFTGTVNGITKSMVGLGNIDNTSDVNKPVSALTQSALDLKADLNSPILTGTPQAPTPGNGDASTKVSTTAFVSTALTLLPTLKVTTSTSVPSSTPTQVGDIFVNTVTKKVYVATGTASSADWTILN